MVSKWRRVVAGGISKRLIKGPIAGPRRGNVDAPIKSLPAEDPGERFLAQ